MSNNIDEMTVLSQAYEVRSSLGLKEVNWELYFQYMWPYFAKKILECAYDPEIQEILSDVKAVMLGYKLALYRLYVVQLEVSDAYCRAKPALGRTQEEVDLASAKLKQLQEKMSSIYSAQEQAHPGNMEKIEAACERLTALINSFADKVIN